jgi:hypothetical protein
METSATPGNTGLTSLDFSQSDNDFESSTTYGAASYEWASDQFMQPFIWETFMDMDMTFDSVRYLLAPHLNKTRCIG